MTRRVELKTRPVQLDDDPHHPAASGAMQDATDLTASIWRYRWLVLFTAALGAAIGYWHYSQTPPTYRATSRLIVESDHGSMIDTLTGNLIGGVPGVDLVRSQLFSDRVGQIAFESEAMSDFRPWFDDDPTKFIDVAKRSLTLEPEVSDYQSSQSLVFLMHFQNANRDLCDAAIVAYSEALQQFFNERQKSSRSELIRLINVAIEQLDPKIAKLESDYREFRKTAPLNWDASGDAINPHRERQLVLVARRTELQEKLHQKESNLAALEAISARAKNPLLALSVLRQVLQVDLEVPEAQILPNELGSGDVALAEIQLDRTLVPLMIERNKLAAQFGDNHPTVTQIDTELQLMKEELSRLVREESKRIVELQSERQKAAAPDRENDAREVIEAYADSVKTEITLLQGYIDDVNDQIETERMAAAELAQFEQENASMLREIERTRELMDQLDEQMARVSLTEEEGSTRVEQLSAPKPASQVGPVLSRSLGIGCFIGIALGAALAFVCEKNANTFRDPDQVAAFLGVPVLTHVPAIRAVKKPSNGHRDMDSRNTIAHRPDSPAAEAVRSLRTSILFDLPGPEGSIIQVTSPLPGDGKSTVAGNLACSMAQGGKRVLVIDCDLRRPQLSENFSVPRKVGLTDVLNGDCEPPEAIHATSMENLYIMPSGPIPTNPAEALTMREMPRLLEVLRDQFDYIILDTPPLLVVTDPSIVAGLADGVVLTLRVRRKSRANAREAVNILRAVKANILGVVINNSDTKTSDGYRSRGYYRYGKYSNKNHGSRKTLGSKSKKKTSNRLTVASRGA